MMKDLQIKNGRVSVKALAKAIGLNGYQSLQRKASKADILFGYIPKVDPGYIRHKDLTKAIELYRDFVLRDAGPVRLKELMDAARFTESPKVETGTEAKEEKQDRFAILDNAYIILAFAGVAMFVQAIQIKEFLITVHKDVNYVGNLPEMMYFVIAICFQALILFLARRGSLWGKVWVALYAAFDFLVNGFLVELFTDFAMDRLLVALMLPAIIGGLLTLLTNKIR